MKCKNAAESGAQRDNEEYTAAVLQHSATMTAMGQSTPRAAAMLCTSLTATLQPPFTMFFLRGRSQFHRQRRAHQRCAHRHTCTVPGEARKGGQGTSRESDIAPPLHASRVDNRVHGKAQEFAPHLQKHIRTEWRNKRNMTSNKLQQRSALLLVQRHAHECDNRCIVSSPLPCRSPCGRFQLSGVR